LDKEMLLYKKHLMCELRNSNKMLM
jgi:hypothetical protein